MDHRSEIARFLRERRDRVTPEQAGFISGARRLPGLRREKVAMLTRISLKYYARMERGDLSGVSPEVLDALSVTLKLDGAEASHLHGLARVSESQRPHRRERDPHQDVRPSLCRVLDSITGSPAWNTNPVQAG